MEDRLRECPFCGKIPVWDSSLCGFIHDLESEEPPYRIAGGLLFDRDDVESWNTRAADRPEDITYAIIDTTRFHSSNATRRGIS